MDHSQRIRARRAHSLNATIAAAATLALLLLALVATPVAAEPGNDNRAPELEGEAAKLNVEAGNKLVFHAYAAGVQIYRWNGTKWDFVAPEAILYANPDSDDDADIDGNGIVGIHDAGPTWTSNSGSAVVGEVYKRATPNPDAIDWLLLKAKSADAPGIFQGVTFIQRLNTVGGKPPTAPGTFIGEEVSIPYTADYYFYRSAQQ